MKKYWIINFIGLLLFYGMSTVSFASEPVAEKVLIKLHQALIQSMQDGETLSFEARQANLAPVVLASFDFDVIGRVVLGRYWKNLDDAQKTEFLEVFKRLSIATYSRQFKHFAGESFEHLDELSMKRGRVLVKTQFVTEERVVAFNYVLHRIDEDWRIINIIVDGVSDLSLKKSDYTAIMKNEGFDALVRKLLVKVENSSNEPSS